jgi:excinuclease ABC subunit C
MDLRQKIRTIPTSPGVYLYKNAEGVVIYVGKAKNLRSRVRSYFLRAAAENAKTGSLMREAVDIEYIVVGTEHEALALENNLIKQKQPRFNILLRDDKTYPCVKLTVNERFPRVYVTRKIRKDNAAYFGPYFPPSLAYRIVDLIHRSFQIPSCKVDLEREHPRPCLQHYIKRCLGPCAAGLVTPEAYGEAVRDVRLLLGGKTQDLSVSLRERMAAAAGEELFELAAKYRDQLVTIDQLKDRQRMDSAGGDDADYLGYHFENHMLAVNLFHVRDGKVMDRREYFWEDLGDLEDEAGFNVGEFFATLLKQLYLDAHFLPRGIYVPVEFEDREALEEVLSQKAGSRVHISVPQRGERRSMLDFAGENARQSYDQRFRVMKPQEDLLKSVLQDVFQLDEPPRRIECFDISHFQGLETVASMVVWEDGRMRNSEYRKFKIKSVEGIDDFASMREVVGRRYARLLEEKKPLPSLVLVDGGLGQLHSAAAALAEIGLQSQPLASIAKREETLYLLGSESEPVNLDHHSPALHLIQTIRDEAHRFAITYHRKRRQMRDRKGRLSEIAGIGHLSAQRLLRHFGSVEAVEQADLAALTSVVNLKQAEAIQEFFRQQNLQREANE